MELRYKRRFERDLRRLRDANLLARVERVIADVHAACEIADVRGIAALQGSAVHYRIRIGDYRLGIEIGDGAPILVRFRHRRDFYQGFP